MEAPGLGTRDRAAVPATVLPEVIFNAISYTKACHLKVLPVLTKDFSCAEASSICSALGRNVLPWMMQAMKLLFGVAAWRACRDRIS